MLSDLKDEDTDGMGQPHIVLRGKGRALGIGDMDRLQDFNSDPAFTQFSKRLHKFLVDHYAQVFNITNVRHDPTVSVTHYYR